MIGFNGPARFALALLLLASVQVGRSSDSSEFPARVLITNDNGIDDPKLVALAQAFSARSEVWVVAPSEDRSGSGNVLSVTRAARIDVQSRYLGEGIQAFAVDGYPTDSIVLALTGMMRECPPDLVVSGINGGANVGSDWMFSGTIGAARGAALFGIPAIAVSGLDDDLPDAVQAVVSWVVELAASPVVKNQAPGEYLTVSIPRTVPSQIRGIRITTRAPLLHAPRMAKDSNASSWKVVGSEKTGKPMPPNSDKEAYGSGYIAVVPMHATEVDAERLSAWLHEGAVIPAWRPSTGDR